MQTANILLSLGGDHNNTVPKYGVTAAEIALLQAIHGNDAVTEVEPLGDIQVTNREELERLNGEYGGAKDNQGNRIVELVYPGRAAAVFRSLDELELIPEQFKVTARASIEAPAPEGKKTRRTPKPETVEPPPPSDGADALFE